MRTSRVRSPGRRATEATPLLGTSIPLDDNAQTRRSTRLPLRSQRLETLPRSPLSWWVFVSFLVVVAVGFCVRTLEVASPRRDIDRMASLEVQTTTSSTLRSPSKEDAALTFQKLAKLVVSDYYRQMVPSLDVFTDDVRPGAVAVPRKRILKTRDALDIFSPVYPNATRTRWNGKHEDVWLALRRQLDKGYEVVGTLLDLNHSHVQYSQSMLARRREEVLDWKRKFHTFQKRHRIQAFLENPSESSYMHAKESHFFWNLADLRHRPNGSDGARSTLCFLGQMQVEAALSLWNDFVQAFESIADEGHHEVYHNFRKTLRSLNDEYSIVGEHMFQTDARTATAFDILRATRTRIGDINDEWTAYSIYAKRREHVDRQKALIEKINARWAAFEQWARESDLDGTLHYLLSIMKSSTPAREDGTVPLGEFLREVKAEPSTSIVIGNQAGDADTIVSSIVLAYVESVNTKQRETLRKTPVVSIAQQDFITKRPETRLLLRLAGLESPESYLVFEDDAFVQSEKPLNVALVDHNRIASRFGNRPWTVTEIVDHHMDEGRYLETCPSPPERTIAFANNTALTASTCTLVAERMKEVWDAPYPSSIAMLLLGVILLDSVNLSHEAGKVTPRDERAVRDLISSTDWDDDDLSERAKAALQITQEGNTPQPDTSALFAALQDAKYDVDFWRSTSVEDCLRYDYKEFPYSSSGDSIGISTILMDGREFVTKSCVVENVLDYMLSRELKFLGIMFVFRQDGRLQRQLALCSTNDISVDALVHYIFDNKHGKALDLHEETSAFGLVSYPQLQVRIFSQLNVHPSRKQIAPILVRYFKHARDG